MELNRRTIAGIPADTYHEARQIYNAQHIYLLIGDQYESLFLDTPVHFSEPQPDSRQDPTSSLWIVTALQYAEYIPDSVASDASRKRVDWKYALHLPMKDIGISAQSLCQFRQGLIRSHAAARDYEVFLLRLDKLGLFPNSTQDELSTGPVTDTICLLTRLHRLYGGMKGALVYLAASSPDWLIQHMPAHWYARYKTNPFHWPNVQNRLGMENEALKLGADIRFLLREFRQKKLPDVENAPEIQQITVLFKEQFCDMADRIHWRQPDCAHCTNHIFSKYEG